MAVDISNPEAVAKTIGDNAKIAAEFYEEVKDKPPRELAKEANRIAAEVGEQLGDERRAIQQLAVIVLLMLDPGE